MAENAEKLLLFHVSEFKGKYPDVPIPKDVLAALGENPSFVTLPIGKVGGFSRNRKRAYSQREIEQIVRLVNERRPEGRVGHASLKERAEKLPPMQWLGAVLEDDGTAWGKAYIYKYAPDLKEHVTVKALANGKVGTSIWGEASTDENGEWTNIDLKSIDISGNPDAISVLDLQSVPIVTAETLENEQGEKPVSDNTQDALIRELNDSRDAREALRLELKETQDHLAEITKERDELREMKTQLSELLGLLGENPKQRIEELVNRDKAYAVVEAAFEDGADIWGRVEVVSEDVATIVGEVAQKISDLQSKLLEAEIKEAIETAVELEPLRPLVSKHIDMRVRLGEVTDVESAKAAIGEFLADDDNKKIAQTLLSELAGGPVVAGTHVPDNAPRIWTPEEQKAAMNAVGL